MSQLTPAQRKKGVIAHSNGNHAQAVAFAAKLLGIKATIVMPDASSLCKVNATREHTVPRWSSVKIAWKHGKRLRMH